MNPGQICSSALLLTQGWSLRRCLCATTSESECCSVPSAGCLLMLAIRHILMDLPTFIGTLKFPDLPSLFSLTRSVAVSFAIIEFFCPLILLCCRVSGNLLYRWVDECLHLIPFLVFSDSFTSK